MSNLQLIEELCHLVERQADIILRLASKLEQVECLSEAERKDVEAARDSYTAILGADEWPDTQ